MYLHAVMLYYVHDNGSKGYLNQIAYGLKCAKAAPTTKYEISNHHVYKFCIIGYVPGYIAYIKCYQWIISYKQL